MYLFALGFGVLLTLAIAAYYVRSPVFSLFHPFSLYTAFHLLVFVIRPIVGYFLDYSTIYAGYRFEPTLADRTTVIFAANLG